MMGSPDLLIDLAEDCCLVPDHGLLHGHTRTRRTSSANASSVPGSTQTAMLISSGAGKPLVLLLNLRVVRRSPSLAARLLTLFFVVVLGASNYTYAEARWSEGLADWIGAHVNAFSVIGGVPKAVVCDNLKAGVTAACRYEPGINRTYQELAEHYDTAILPTRPRRPRDKAKVEVAVQIVQRFVLARLRNRRFFSLHELNAAIRETVADLNAKIMRKLGVRRDELFAEIDRPALKALPTAPYQYAEWKKCRVAPDYHVEIADHYYSVPSRLIREQLEARVTDTTIEILYNGVRVASHPALRRDVGIRPIDIHSWRSHPLSRACMSRQ